MTEPSAAERDAIDELAESFVARLRAGERPSVEEYVGRYPELADEVRELLPALVLLEQNASIADGTSGTDRAPGAAPPTPREIGDFTIVREIGRGGMGVVYEAIQQSLGRHVALKVLSAPALLNPTHLERFRLEARAAARLHHTHIVPVFGVGEHEGLHYYAMQFIQGQSLDLVIDELRRMRHVRRPESTVADGGDALTRVVAGGMLSGQFPTSSADADAEASADGGKNPSALPPSEFTTTGGRGFYQSVARVGLQVSEALAYAHGEGILHRDIKPSNLLIDAKGSVWITDFGLAKDEAADGLTQTGDFVGTLRYMPPERIDGWSDPRSDVYSLGATLYELATLSPIFGDSSRGRLVEQIYYDAPTPPSKLDAAMPSDLETIVLKATAKEPGERYRTAAEMAEDLRRFLVDRPILARRSTPLEQLVRWGRRNPLVAALVGAVAALALLAVVILSVSNARIRNESAARAAALNEKDAALSTAHDAINQMLTRTASDVFADAPRLHPVRVALLEDSLRFYEALAANSGADPRLRHEMASVLHAKANLERELDSHGAAADSLRRCIALLEPLLPLDPEPPEYLEQLAVAEQDLALTMHFEDNRSARDSRVEAQFQRALDLFDDLQRRWPERPQPVVLCLRHLAWFAQERGEVAQAEGLLRTAIDRGEKYAATHPDDLNETHETAWACTNLYDLLMDAAPPRIDEAEATLRRGLRPLAAQLRVDPKATGAIDVAAAVRIRLALCSCRQDRAGEAMPLFRRTIGDMEKLCEAFPWNEYYWGNLTWFHEEMANSLRGVDRADEADGMLREYRDWLQQVAAELPDDPGPRAKLRRAQTDLGRLLRDAGVKSEE